LSAWNSNADAAFSPQTSRKFVARSSAGENRMKSKVVVEGRERTFVLILDQAEEAFQTLSKFADQERITGASVTAIGAFEHAKVGWFDFSAKRYKPISVAEQCEVLSLVGDIAQGDDAKASLHLHAVLGLSDGSVRGGHLLEGIVRPTLEVTIVETAAHLRRKKKQGLGIALIEL
jgi:predicted DNA-binding protein with PD1-like motif